MVDPKDWTEFKVRFVLNSCFVERSNKLTFLKKFIVTYAIVSL